MLFPMKHSLFQNLLTIILVIIFTTSFFVVAQNECNDIEIQKLCLDQENCDSCLSHPCCTFCYDEKFVGRRCNLESEQTGCDTKKLEKSPRDGLEILLNDDFTVITDDTDLEQIIQMRPQHVKLKLRKGIPLNFTFTYQPADNYPLDLYYLGDLSLSMSQNIAAFKSLGKDLPGNLSALTKNYKLAYGSFMDKPGMPFYFTDPESINNPCHHELGTCERGYSFKHRLDFTKDINTFLEKVEKSKLTANVDDLDGALDAILQIIYCEKRIGFSKNSRKIILLPTDSLLHTAGDGVLVGAALRPTDECLLDKSGEHSKSLLYDYPSLELIQFLLKQKKYNIIFAVKSATKLNYYTNMTNDVLRGFVYVAELEEESKNILDLIKNGYYSVAEQVSFAINLTNNENYNVKFFADCDNVNVYNETSVCYHVKNKPIKFKVQITLLNIPSGKEKDTLFIEEKNINEKIQLSINYLGICKCSNYENLNNTSCFNGNLKCGECICQEGWTGIDCSVECNEGNDFDCRLEQKNGVFSKICHGNGECNCGKCTCNLGYTGDYCEYECPSRRNRMELIVCGGPNRGKCHKGECICEKGYQGTDCSCSTSKHDCSFDGSSICSDQGTCVCNECKCNENFTGKFCEKSRNDGNNTICEKFEDVVKNDNGKKMIKLNGRELKIVDESDRNEFSCGEDVVCTTASYVGNSRCIYEYCYYQSEDSDDITIPMKKICTLTAGLKAIFLAAIIVAAILILGILLIASYKYKIYKEEKAEYEKFMAIQKNASEMNPIYKSPVTEYSNPLRSKSD